MKLSLSSFVYFNYSLPDAIRKIAAAGYEGIDIWGGRPHAYRRDLQAGKLHGVRQLLDDLDLTVASFIPAQFRYPTCLCSGDERIRQDSVAYICDSIVTAVGLGAPIVSVCPGHSLHGQGVQDAWGRLCESLDSICRFAQPYSMRVAIEPADRYETDLVQTTADALRIVHDLEHENLGVLLDNGHAFVVGESAAQAVTALGDRLFHVHVDDNDGARDQHLVPGDGSFEFGPFLMALKKVGYDRFLCAELGWDYTVDPDPAVAATIRNMRGLLAKSGIPAPALFAPRDLAGE